MTRSPLGGWWWLTTPPEAAASATFAARERARRGRLVSVLLLAFLLIEAGAFWQYRVVDDDHPLMIAVLLAVLAVAVLAGVLNRLGWVTPAAILMVVVADLPLAGVHATAVAGKIDVPHLGAYYLLAGAELVAASALAPWTVFLVALANSGLVAASIALAPKTPALAHLLASNDGQQIVAGPVVMQAVVAVVAFLWARSTLSALRRADRAEEVAELERREVERKRELEEGVRQLLAVHVQLANGNFAARVPPVRDPLLWQVGSSLNMLVARIARLAQGDYLARRMQDEARRLAEAVRIAQAGRQPVWPAPSGTPLDDLALALGTLTGPPGPLAQRGESRASAATVDAPSGPRVPAVSGPRPPSARPAGAPALGEDTTAGLPARLRPHLTDGDAASRPDGRMPRHPDGR
jgi:hypothetical protein